MSTKGRWLGIDIGSGYEKVCSFCLVEADERGPVSVRFEKGPAEAPYPRKNRFDLLIDPGRGPTYLKSEIEGAIGMVLERSELVERFLGTPRAGRLAVGIDAPVHLAVGEGSRATERQSTATFATPSRARFESDLGAGHKPGFYTSNTYWKCVGFAVYRWLANRLFPEIDASSDQAAIAALTCRARTTAPSLRETFPSDTYKRMNGTVGQPTHRLRSMVAALLEPEVRWRGEPNITPRVLERLHGLRDRLRADLLGTGPALSMHKPGGLTGDLWDAFCCALVVYCEDRGCAHFHGWDGCSQPDEVIRREGVIATVEGIPID